MAILLAAPWDEPMAAPKEKTLAVSTDQPMVATKDSQMAEMKVVDLG